MQISRNNKYVIIYRMTKIICTVILTTSNSRLNRMWKYDNYSINLPQTFMSSHYIDSWKLFQGKSDSDRNRRHCPSIQTWSTNTLTGRIDGFHVSSPAEHISHLRTTSDQQTRVGARYPSVASTPRGRYDQNNSTRPLGTSPGSRWDASRSETFYLTVRSHLNLHPTPGSPGKLKPPDTQKKTQVNNRNSGLSFSRWFSVRCFKVVYFLSTVFICCDVSVCMRHLKDYSALFFCWFDSHLRRLFFIYIFLNKILYWY